MFKIKQMLRVLRRPVPRWVTTGAIAAALGMLGTVLVARQFPAGRQALWVVYSRLNVLGGRKVTVNLREAEKRIREAAGGPGTLPLPEGHIVIHKKARRLELYAGERLVKSYAVTMGRHADEGPKTRQGDGSTPEGKYFICTRNGRSRFHLFLGLNYPNTADAARGMENRLIDEAQRMTMAAADATHQRPPWDTRLGGEIGIHGGGLNPPGWTFGCIAVENPDIEELWLATAMGTPVEIRP